MKHSFRKLLVALLLTSTAPTMAQQMPMIPIDKDVRIGKLKNGLTYYIRKNTNNEKRADFYIAQKVGSILEEPQQRGLAHFLEHMAFNGTKHFPGNDKKLGLIAWCESIGIKFGADLNAGTGINETIYNISNAPVTRDGIIDSCLLILHDWSSDLLLTDSEIDKERGVVHEEWRSTTGANMRFYEKALPVIYEGTKYANCLPIGTMEVIDNFKYNVLRNYYEKWYRPDLQGLIIVGDIDVDAMERKIQKMFNDIPKPINPATRVYYPVLDNKEPIIYIGKEKEQTDIQVQINFKHDALPDSLKTNTDYLRTTFIRKVINKMMDSRLNELTQTATPPFIYAGASDDDFLISRTKRAFAGITGCKEGGIDTAFSSLLREIERAHRFGFTESEFQRARAEYLSTLEAEYNERNKKKNRSYIDQYVNHFLYNEPIPSIEDRFELMKQIANQLSVDAINEKMKSYIGVGNEVVTVFGPDKEGLTYPTKEEIRSIMKKVKAEKITAYVDKVSNKPLISKVPKAGKTISMKDNCIYGSTILTLSNGVKIVVKKTNFKSDEIRMKATSIGGTSVIPNSEIININALDDNVAELGGIGEFDTMELEKMLAGKRASVMPFIGSVNEGVRGGCSSKDLETLLQLTYLTFTAPRMDTNAFKSYIARQKASLQNKEADPMVAFRDSTRKTIYGNHPRIMRLKADLLDKIDYNKCIELYKERFKNASEFTFVFVGNLDLEAAKPLFETYLGSLPSSKKKETFKDNKFDVRKGEIKNIFVKKQEIPKATVFAMYSGKCKYNMQNKLMLKMIDQILYLVYTEKIREQEGGTYGVGVNGDLNKYPKEEFQLHINFQTDPAKKDKLTKIVFDEVSNLAQNGPSESNLNKVKGYLLKSHKEIIKENRFWLTIMDEYFYTGIDMTANYEEFINNLTVNDIKKFAQSIFKQGNCIEVTMTAPDSK